MVGVKSDAIVSVHFFQNDKPRCHFERKCTLTIASLSTKQICMWAIATATSTSQWQIGQVDEWLRQTIEYCCETSSLQKVSCCFRSPPSLFWQYILTCNIILLILLWLCNVKAAIQCLVVCCILITSSVTNIHLLCLRNLQLSLMFEY